MEIKLDLQSNQILKIVRFIWNKRSEVFHYASGVSLGLIGSILLVFLVIARYVPKVIYNFSYLVIYSSNPFLLLVRKK